MLRNKKRRCGADPESTQDNVPQPVSNEPLSSVDNLSVEDIDKQIELLQQLKITKQRGSTKGKRKLNPSLLHPAVVERRDSNKEQDDEEEAAQSKSRRRFITQESVKDSQLIRSLYYERREELMARYSGQWIVFGMRGGESDEVDVLGTGPSALAAYYAAMSSLKDAPMFDVICVGSEDLVCKLPVKVVFNPTLTFGADIYVC
jgi:hypothetical protein